MNIILTLEGVWISLFVINSFHLDCCVIQVVFPSKQISYLRKCFQRFDWLNMTCHRHFADRNGPDMEVMHIDDIGATFVVDVIAKLLNIDVSGRAFHHNSDDVLNDWHRCPDNDEWEEICAEGISVPSWREEVNYCCGNNNANAHHNITKDMNKSGINVDIAMTVAMSRNIISMVVNMIVAVGIETNIVTIFLIMFMFSLMAFFIWQQGLLYLVIIDLFLCLVLSMVVSMRMSMRVTMRVTVFVTVHMIMATTFLSTQMIMPIAWVQNFHLDEVKDKAHDSDDKHDISFYSRRFKETLCGLDK